MALKRFSQTVKDAILRAFPALSDSESLSATEGCWSIRYPSPYADVDFYVSTEDGEITIAMGGWHTHIAMFEEKSEAEEIEEAIELIRSILEDHLVVAYASRNGKWSGSWVVEGGIDKEAQEDEVVSLRRWTRID